MNIEDIYNVKNEIGLFVRAMREAKGYNQEEISQGICSMSTLSRIEAGERTVDFLIIETLLDRMKVEKIEYEFVLDEEEYIVYKQREEIVSLTNHAKNSPTSIGGEMNWHKKLSLDHRKKIEYT